MDSPVSSTAPRRRKWVLALSLALFALVAAALLAATALIFRTIGAERSERQLIARTDDVLAAIADIGRAAVNGETGQRGYFITLDRSYLAPYELGRAAYPSAVRRLHGLLAGRSDPRTGQLLGEIERLANARFRELDHSVRLIAEHRLIDAQQAILSDEGLRLMQRLRATLAELERIERGRLDVASSQTAELEARIVPLLLALLSVVVGALALGLWQIARAARAEAQAAQAPALAEARDRADLLARELNHRVKNLFAVILGIVRMTARGKPEAADVVERIAQRIHALVKAHEVTQGAGASATVDLRQLIETAIAPYRSEVERCTLDGPAVTLAGKTALPLGLVLHELVTNAVKYGAWSQPGGLIEVTWRADGKLALAWRETATAAVAGANGNGFGSRLIESSARQLGGTIQRTYRSDGVDVQMTLPLPSERAE